METQEHQLYRRFDQYLSDNLSKEDRLTLESELETSPEIRREFEAFIQTKRLALQAGIQKEKESLHEISSRFHMQKQRRNRFLITGSLMAAALAILLAVITLRPSAIPADPAEVFAQNFVLPEAPAPMGAVTDSMLQLANAAYAKGDFAQAISSYQEIEVDSLADFQQSQVAYYSGLSHLALGKGEQARTQLARALQQKEQADWYTALSWLKEAEGKPQAIAAFSRIAETAGHFYQEKAKEILKDLQK